MVNIPTLFGYLHVSFNGIYLFFISVKLGFVKKREVVRGRERETERERKGEHTSTELPDVELVY